MKLTPEVFGQRSVLVVGDIMLDRYIWGDVRRISPEAPVPVVSVRRETFTAGGAGNLALNLAALGLSCELFGIIGDDAHGSIVANLLRKGRIAVDERLVRPGVSTITKTRIIAQRQQVCRLDEESRPETYDIAGEELLNILADRVKAHDLVVLSDYAKGVISQPAIDIIRGARATRPSFIAMDPKPVRLLDVSGFDLLTPNHAEALQLAGLSPESGVDLKIVIDRIMARYAPKILVVTMGEEGMMLRTRSGIDGHFPTAAREVADVSGAGDTVIAILAAALAGGMPPTDAVRLANVAAGLVIAKLGTAIISLSELREAAATK